MSIRAAFSRLAFSARTAPDLKQRLEQLGPVYVKIGQHLALRPDLIPPDVAQKLLLLTDKVSFEPQFDVAAVLDEDLDLRPADISLSQEPIAAGSLAQVYSGMAPDGTRIAVKVKRPGIDEKIRESLGSLSIDALRAIVDLSTDIGAAEFAADICDSLLRELDFHAELRNLQRMREHAVGNQIMAFPRAYPKFSSGRIVTMEFFEGRSLTSVLTAAREYPPGVSAYPDIDNQRVAGNLVWSALEQIFVFQTFHADMHPGNIIILPGNVIGFVDLGLVGSLSTGFQSRLAGYLRAIHDDDVERVIDGALRLLQHTDRSNPAGFRSDFTAAHEQWARTRGESGSEARTGVYLVDLLRAARRNRLVVPREMLALYRSLCTAELIASQIAPTGNLSAVGSRFFREQERKRFFDHFRQDDLQREARDIIELLLDGPGRLSQVLDDLSGNRFVLQVETTESARARAQADLRAKLIAIAISCVSLAILLIGLMNTRTSWSSYLGAAVGAVLIAAFSVMGLFSRRLH